MNESGGARREARALAALGFDPNSVLEREPGVLLDPHFLGAMHAELEAELGAAEAATALMQIGFIQGLQDAWRVADAAAAHGFALPPPLAMRFQGVRGASVAGAIELVGTWPERTEAGARLSLVGASAAAACHLSAGYTSGWLSGTMDADILVLETSCAASGARECRFVAREVELWRATGDERALALLPDLPFDAVRELIEESSARVPDRTTADRVEETSGIVHIWDTVMVIPFTKGDEALRAVDLIGDDPAARGVSVVVVDLANAILDEAFDAVLLDQILAAIHARGAETILAAVSPLSEKMLAELDQEPLVVHKDLDQAIAMAFRVAMAQQTPV